MKFDWPAADFSETSYRYWDGSERQYMYGKLAIKILKIIKNLPLNKVDTFVEFGEDSWAQLQITKQWQIINTYFEKNVQSVDVATAIKEILPPFLKMVTRLNAHTIDSMSASELYTALVTRSLVQGIAEHACGWSSERPMT